MTKAKFKWGDGPMPEALFEAFYKDVHKLIKQHFGTDSDGDFPVEVEIVDRTRYNRSHYHLIPYDHKTGDDAPVSEAEFRRILRLAAANVAMAAEDMRREVDIFDIRFRDIP